MNVLFSNPPWWGKKVMARLPNISNPVRVHTAGVRAGSRWPWTGPVISAPDQFRAGDYLPYPFFMGYAATYVQKNTQANVFFRDSIALRDSYESFAQYVRKISPEYFFIESATPSWDHDQKVIRKLSKLYPHMKIVVTGPIASKAKELLEQNPIHAVIHGEYEKGAIEVLNGAQGIIRHNLLSKKEMNDAPFPWFDEEHAYLYWDANPKGQLMPQAQVWSSRGCPYKCIFCVWPATMTGNDPDGASRRTVRHYTPEYMEAFLKEITSKYTYRTIYFDDDTFNLGNRHVINMCNVMQKIGLPWSAMCRADTIKMETWKLMKDSGCFGVKLGFESGNQFVVDKIVNKHLNLDYAAKVVHHLKEIGMSVHGTFTYGLPGETPQQRQDTKQYIASLPFDTIQQSGTAEIEGTPLATLAAGGEIKNYDAAQTDENYVRNTDGAQKWREMNKDFQNS